MSKTVSTVPDRGKMVEVRSRVLKHGSQKSKRMKTKYAKLGEDNRYAAIYRAEKTIYYNVDFKVNVQIYLFH